MLRDSFKQAVDSKDIETIRLQLSNELLLDPRGGTFNEMLSYALENVSNIFSDRKSQFEIKTDKSFWDNNYLYALKNEIDECFSKELLSHYERVAKAVLKEKCEKLNAEQKQNCKEKSPNSRKYNGIAGGTLLACGAALAIAGACVAKGSLIKIGGVCLIAGGILTYTHFKK